LAGQGNLRAVQVLAGYKDASALAPLTDLANKTTATSLRLALGGLANHWAEKSVPVFKKYLDDPDKRVKSVALRGLGNSKDSAVVPLVLPLLDHKDYEVQDAARFALEQLPPGPHADKYLDRILTGDERSTYILVQALIRHKWEDKTAIPRLADKLQSSKGAQRFQIIRLLRHLSNNAMGPDTWDEFERNPDDWVRRWREWAAKQ
jgi:HEAT repeat protein